MPHFAHFPRPGENDPHSPQNSENILNEDFTKVVQRGGGGGHRFMKLFHKILFFYLMASLSRAPKTGKTLMFEVEI